MELSDKKPMPLPFIRDPRPIACGCVVTRHDLPANNRRWSPGLKAMVAKAIKHGVITMDEASARYATDARELGRWITLLDQHGIPGLRADGFEQEVQPAEADELGALQEGPLMIDFAARLVRISGEAIPVPPIELRVLALLIRRTPCTVGRDEIFAMLYGGKSRQPKPKILDVLVCKIRRRLNCRDAIETIWGRGWRWKGFGNHS